MGYAPGVVVSDPALQNELIQISRAISDIESRVVDQYNAAPAKPRDGQLVYADGVNWDPGSGEGFYAYYNATWNYMNTGSASAGFQGLGTWRHRTETATPPASGQIRFNNATPASATSFYVHETNDGADDMANFLALLDDGAIIYLQDKSNAANFYVIEISSITDSGTYKTYGIQNITQVGAEPGQNQAMLLFATTAEGAGGAGEANTGSNQGTDGVGVFDVKSGVDLQFRHVAPASSKVTTTLNGKDIDVDIVEANISHDALADFLGTEHIAEASLSIAETQIPDGSLLARLAANERVTGNWDIDDPQSAAQPIGYNTMPIYEIDVNDIFDIAHQGMIWHKDSGVAVTFTCDNVAGIDQGATWVVHNDDTEDLTIAQGSGVTVFWIAAGVAPVAGNVTVEQGGIITVYKYSDTEYWCWGAKELAGAVGQLSDLSDVTSAAVTNRFALMADGAAYVGRAVVEADISNLQSYLLSETNDLSAAVVWANVPNANITQGSVTQHQAALAILESQITDGTILGRLAANERVTGAWDIDDPQNNPQPVGYNTMPIYEIDVSDIFDIAHQGMLWHKDAGVAVTFTCDNVAGIDQGATWVVHNDDTEDLTIAQGTGVTIYWLEAGGAPSAGNVTVEQGGIVTVYKYTDTEFWCWGTKTLGAAEVNDLSVAVTWANVPVANIPNLNASKITAGTFVAGRIPTHTGHVTGQTALSLVVAAITGQTDIGANLISTDEVIVNDGGSIRRADISRFNNYFNGALAFNNYSHPNHTGHVSSTGDGATALLVAAITGQTDIGTNIAGADEIIINDNGVIRRADVSRFNAYFNSALAFNDYTHPGHPGDDFSVDSTLLSGATVISDIDINVTTDTEGHVTDANGSIATRNLTPANIGAEPADADITKKNETEVITGLWTLDAPVNVSGYGTGGRVKDGDDNAQPIGFNVLDYNARTSAFTLTLASNGQRFNRTVTTAFDITCPNLSTLPVGATWVFTNQGASGLFRVKGASGVTLRHYTGDAVNSVTAGTGFTLAVGAVLTINKVTNTEYHIWGSGITTS